MAVADKLKALQIKANIIADKSIGMMEINVDVQGDTAILTGEVDNQKQKEHAEELSYEIDGIYDVQNDIEIVPQLTKLLSGCSQTGAHLGFGPLEGNWGKYPFSLTGKYAPPGAGFAASEQFPGEFSDEEIEKELHKKLSEQKDIDASNINFEVNNQVVKANGTINSEEDANQIQDIIMSIRGVMGICGDISIKKKENN